MPISAASQRRKSVAALLEVPDAGAWGVALAYVGGSSDKEYRIVVDGSDVVFSWGRSGAEGEARLERTDSPAAAAKLAIARWAAKEGKVGGRGYWPVTGILRLDAGPRRAEGARQLLDAAMRDRVQRLGSGRLVGDELWLVQTPPVEASVRAHDQVAALARSGGLLSGNAPLTSGAFCLVGVGPVGAGLIRQVCPVAIRVGARSAKDDRALAEVATALAGDGVEGEPVRVALDRALDMARLVLA